MKHIKMRLKIYLVLLMCWFFCGNFLSNWSIAQEGSRGLEENERFKKLLMEELAKLKQDMDTEARSQQQRRILRIVKNLPDKNDEFNHLSSVVVYCIRKKQFADAFSFQAELIKTAKQTRDTALSLSNAYNLEGVIHHAIGRYSDAVNSYYKAFHLNQPVIDSQLAFYQTNNLANMYLYQDKYEEAKHYYDLALGFVTNKTEDFQYFEVLYNVAELHNKTSESKKMGKIISEMEKLWIENQLDSMYYYRIQLRKAEWHLLRKESDRSLIIYNNIRLHSLKNKDYEFGLEALIQILNILLEKKQYFDFSFYIQEAMELVPKVQSMQSKIDIYSNLAKYYDEIGDFKKASMAKDSLMVIQNLFYEKKMDEDLVATNLVNEMKIKERQILLLEKETILKEETIAAQNWRFRFSFLITLFLITLLSFIVVFFIRSRKLNNQLLLKKIELEQKNEIIDNNNQKLKKIAELNSRIFLLSSHDIRAPLNSVYVLMKSFWEKRKDKLTQRELDVLDDFNRGMDNIYQLIDLVSNWSVSFHQSSLAPNTAFKPFNVSVLADDVMALFEPIARSKNLLLINQIDDKKEVSTDYHLLHGIIRNLLHNSIKFTGVGGVISLHSKIEGDKLLLIISDSGKSGEISQEEKDEGLGKGLSLLTEILENFNGSLSLQKNKKGGMDAMVYIPIFNLDIENFL